MGGLEGEKGRGNCIIILLSKTKQKPQTQGNLPYQTLTNKTKINHPPKQTKPTHAGRGRKRLAGKRKGALKREMGAR